MVFEPPIYEASAFEGPTFEAWAIVPLGTDPDRHPDPDLTVLVEVGPTVAVFIEV
jgi:hypothetical protein